MAEPREPKNEHRPAQDSEETERPEADLSEGFDALAAAAELDASLAEAGGTGAPGKEGGYVAMLESDVESLGALVEEKEAQIRRLRADAEQAREEVSRSRERLEREAHRDAGRKVDKLLLDVLELLDDLDRALEAGRHNASEASIVEGVELLRQKFLGTLSRHGVRHRPALGEVFDPEHHEAVSTAPADDPARAGRVVAVVREGYDLGERPLRPAQVVVGSSR